MTWRTFFAHNIIFPLALLVQKQIIVDPLAFTEERFRPSLEERLESIISGAALMADSSCTRDDRRERIVAECNSVRQALQDLLSEYMGNVSGLPCFLLSPHYVFTHTENSQFMVVINILPLMYIWQAKFIRIHSRIKFQFGLPLIKNQQ